MTDPDIVRVEEMIVQPRLAGVPLAEVPSTSLHHLPYL